MGRRAAVGVHIVDGASWTTSRRLVSLVALAVSAGCAASTDALAASQADFDALIAECETMLGDVVELDAFAGMDAPDAPGRALAVFVKRGDMVSHMNWIAARSDVRMIVEHSPDATQCWMFDRAGHVIGRWFSYEEAQNRTWWRRSGSGEAPRLTNVREDLEDPDPPREGYAVVLGDEPGEIETEALALQSSRTAAWFEYDSAAGVLSLTIDSPQVLRFADDGTRLSEQDPLCGEPFGDCEPDVGRRSTLFRYDEHGNLAHRRTEILDGTEVRPGSVVEVEFENQLNDRGDWIARRIILNGDASEWEHRRVVYWDQ